VGKERGFQKLPDPRSGQEVLLPRYVPLPFRAGPPRGPPGGLYGSDILCRFKKMNGFDVLHPMGWTPSAAGRELRLETGIHPEIITARNIANFKRQIKSWASATTGTRNQHTDPSYYNGPVDFLQLFKKGLAYESTIPINWCPSCKTAWPTKRCSGAPANAATRHRAQEHAPVDPEDNGYAQRLLDDLQGLDWPESTLLMQKNWIGRSEGAEVHFPLEGSDKKLTVFTPARHTLRRHLHGYLPGASLVAALTTRRRPAR